MAAEQRVFLRVRLPGEQLRLYQLQPHVKLSNISRSLKVPGNLFFQGRKIDETATPEHLGLRCGVENVVEIVFVPQEPQASLMQSSSYAETPTAVSSERAPVGSDLPVSRYNAADIQRLLRMLQDREDQATVASPSGEGLEDAPQRSGPPTEGTASVTVVETQPSGLATTPASTPYNPRGNLLRATDQQQISSTVGDSAASRPPRLQNFVDRPPRKTLPTERRHADTTTPHTVWPNHEGPVGATMESHVVHSPNLQGTKRRDNNEASFLTLHASPVVASGSRDRNPVGKYEKIVGTDDDIAGAQGTIETGAHRGSSEPAVDSQRILLLEETIEALKLELIEERVRRQQLELSLRRLEERYPDSSAEPAEKQHYRIMQELREQRRTRHVHV